MVNIHTLSELWLISKLYKYCRNVPGVWGCKPAELLTPLFLFFFLPWLGFFSTHTSGIILQNSFHPHLKEGIVHFSKWRVCNTCSWQRLLGRIQLNTQLRAQRPCQFFLPQYFGRHRRWPARHAARWKKKKNYYHFIKVWKIKNIFLSITRSLSLEFDLWPPGGLCTVLAWCYHTHPQMASLRLLHSQLFIYIYIYLIASVTDFLQSLRASKQDHSVMHSRDRQENKINEKSTEVLSLLTSFKWILARKLRIEVNCFGISPFR